LLADGIRKVPDSATLRHALGLSLVRQKKKDAALQLLARASKLAPDNSRYAYVYAVALHSTGKIPRALRVLEQTHAKHPADLDTLFALATFNWDAGDLTRRF
jgi:predicted Zn-dependent protease